MNRFFLSTLFLLNLQFVDAQRIKTYLFTRTPQLVNYQFERSETTYSHGLSAGIGFIHKSNFLELGSFIFEGDSYGYYSFFGRSLKSTELVSHVTLQTNWYGEVTRMPSQQEQKDASWIFTSGLCLFPNVQLKRVNIGIPLCLGLAYQEKDFYLNSRFILNLSYHF